MANIVLNVPTEHVNISPALFREFARQYLQCESSFVTDAPYSPVPYFLVCRAIELELKAKHLEAKSRLQVKKQYGHNLLKLYDQLPALSKTLEALERQELARASEIYDIPNKGFEYVSVYDALTGLKHFPSLPLLKHIAAKLANNDA